jgi:hypothetical protein
VEAIQPSTSGISEPTTDSSTPAAPTTGYPTQIDQIINNVNTFSNYYFLIIHGTRFLIKKILYPGIKIARI